MKQALTQPSEYFYYEIYLSDLDSSVYLYVPILNLTVKVNKTKSRKVKYITKSKINHHWHDYVDIETIRTVYRLLDKHALNNISYITF